MKNIIQKSLWQFKALEYLAYFTVVVVPLIVLKGHLFPYTSVKSFLALAIVCVMVILCVWGKNGELRAGQGSLRITWLHTAVAFFMATLGISATLGVQPGASWLGTFLQGTGLVYIYAFIIFGLIVGTLTRHRENFLSTFLHFTFASGVIVAFISWFNVNATIGNTSFLGSYLLFIAIIGIALCVSRRTRGQKMVAGIATLTVLLSPSFFNVEIWKGTISLSEIIHNPLLLIGSANGTVFGFVVALLIAGGLFSALSKKKIIRWVGIVICTTTVISVGVIGYQLMTDGTSIREKFIEQKTASRFVYWDIASKGFSDRPLTGYGWGNYDAVYQKHFDPIVFAPGYATEPSVMDPHNVMFAYASTTGILGLLAYVVLLGATCIAFYKVAKNSDRKRRVITIMLGASVIGYFIQNMFIFDTPVTYLVLFSVIGIAAGLAPVRWVIPMNKKYSLFYKTEAVVITGVSLACIVLFAILPMHESRAWQQRLTGVNVSSESPQSMSLVGNANDTSFIAIKFFIQTKENIQNSKEFALKTWALLAGDLEHDIRKYPDNYKPYLVKGILENGIVSISKKSNPELMSAARADLEKAIDLNPSTPEPYFHLAQTVVHQQNPTDAYAYIRAGIEIAPYYASGYRLAEALLKLAPNKEFEMYLAEMQKKWNIQI